MKKKCSYPLSASYVIHGWYFGTTCTLEIFSNNSWKNKCFVYMWNISSIAWDPQGQQASFRFFQSLSCRDKTWSAKRSCTKLYICQKPRDIIIYSYTWNCLVMTLTLEITFKLCLISQLLFSHIRNSNFEVISYKTCRRYCQIIYKWK